MKNKKDLRQDTENLRRRTIEGDSKEPKFMIYIAMFFSALFVVLVLSSM